MTSAADQSTFAQPRSSQKSAITNGTRLLAGVDGRGPWVRRCRDLIADLTNDRGGASVHRRRGFVDQACCGDVG
jgi:hypothetical protein